MTDAGEPGPRLTLSDVAMLASLVNVDGDAAMDRVIVDVEYFMRSTPTFEELSYGVPRLIAAGLVERSSAADGSLVLRATDTARSMYPRGLGAIQAVFTLAEALDVESERHPTGEDRRLGPLRGFEERHVRDLLSVSARRVASIPVVRDARLHDAARNADSEAP